jgi:hypothetical protein
MTTSAIAIPPLVRVAQPLSTSRTDNTGDVEVGLRSLAAPKDHGVTECVEEGLFGDNRHEGRPPVD